MRWPYRIDPAFWREQRAGIDAINRRTLDMLTRVEMAVFAALTAGSCLIPIYRDVTLPYGVMLAFALVLWLILRRSPDRLWATTLSRVFTGGALALSIYIGTVRNVEQCSVLFFVMEIMLPTLFLDRPLYAVAMNTAATAAYVALVCLLKPDATVRVYELMNAALTYVTCCFFTLKMRRMMIENLQAKQKLARRAERDMLTGVLSRAELERVAASRLTEQRPCALLMIDIDNFKHVNDTVGHQAGDKVLHRFGELLLRLCRKDDIVGRYGGDEFVILLRDTVDLTVIGGKLNELLEQTAEVGLQVIGEPLSYSAGVALNPDGDIGFEQLIRCADDALYRRKKEGKHGFTVYQAAR